jgi:hypothetical protein
VFFPNNTANIEQNRSFCKTQVVHCYDSSSTPTTRFKGVTIKKQPRTQDAAEASPASPLVVLSCLSAQAAPVLPQQAQHRRFTAHSFVSLRRCPCFSAMLLPKQPFTSIRFFPPV